VYAVNSGNKQGQTGTSPARPITAQSLPTAPSVSAASVQDGTAPGAIRWTWSGGAATTGGTANLTYQVSVDGGGWIDKGTATNHTASSLGAGSHDIRVRAVNKAGAGAIGQGGAGTVSNPPPVVSVQIVGKGTRETCDGGGACWRALVRVSNGPAGNYTLAISDGGWTSPYPRTTYLNGNGTAESGGYFGTRSGQVCVVVTGAMSTTVCIPAGTWNSFPNP
jgi:hypothetical protein